MKAKKYWYGCVLQQCWFQRQAVDRPQEVLEAMRLVDREYRKQRELRRGSSFSKVSGRSYRASWRKHESECKTAGRNDV